MGITGDSMHSGGWLGKSEGGSPVKQAGIGPGGVDIVL